MSSDHRLSSASTGGTAASDQKVTAGDCLPADKLAVTPWPSVGKTAHFVRGTKTGIWLLASNRVEKLVPRESHSFLKWFTNPNFKHNSTTDWISNFCSCNLWPQPHRRKLAHRWHATCCDLDLPSPRHPVTVSATQLQRRGEQTVWPWAAWKTESA